MIQFTHLIDYGPRTGFQFPIFTAHNPRAGMAGRPRAILKAKCVGRTPDAIRRRILEIIDPTAPFAPKTSAERVAEAQAEKRTVVTAQRFTAQNKAGDRQEILAGSSVQIQSVAGLSCYIKMGQDFFQVSPEDAPLLGLSLREEIIPLVNKDAGSPSRRFPYSVPFASQHSAAFEADRWKFILQETFQCSTGEWSLGSRDKFITECGVRGLDHRAMVTDLSQWGVELTDFIESNRDTLEQLRMESGGETRGEKLFQFALDKGNSKLETWASQRIEIESSIREIERQNPHDSLGWCLSLKYVLGNLIRMKAHAPKLNPGLYPPFDAPFRSSAEVISKLEALFKDVEKLESLFHDNLQLRYTALPDHDAVRPSMTVDTAPAPDTLSSTKCNSSSMTTPTEPSVSDATPITEPGAAPPGSPGTTPLGIANGSS